MVSSASTMDNIVSDLPPPSLVAHDDVVGSSESYPLAVPVELGEMRHGQEQGLFPAADPLLLLTPAMN